MTGRPKECCTERGKMSCRRKYRKGNKRACMGARRRFWKEQMSYKLETGGWNRGLKTPVAGWHGHPEDLGPSGRVMAMVL